MAKLIIRYQSPKGETFGEAEWNSDSGELREIYHHLTALITSLRVMGACDEKKKTKETI